MFGDDCVTENMEEQNHSMLLDIIQIDSGITRGRVLNGELYTQILQNLIDQYLSTDCFMKISLRSSVPIPFNVDMMLNILQWKLNMVVFCGGGL